MARIAGKFKPGTPEWHALRAGRIGGSEIGSVVGWSHFVTREDVMLQKLGLAPPVKLNAAMERGNILEDPVAQWLAGKFGLEYDEEGSKNTYLHDVHDWALFNPDRLTMDGRRLVEIKTTNNLTQRYDWGPAGSGLVPLNYEAQAHWGMGIMGIEETYFGVLAGAKEGRPDLHFTHYVVPFNEKVFAYLIGEAEKFYIEYLERSKA